MQSAGMDAWRGTAASAVRTTEFVARFAMVPATMSTAVMSPAQPRNGSRTTIKLINKMRTKRAIR